MAVPTALRAPGGRRRQGSQRRRIVEDLGKKGLAVFGRLRGERQGTLRYSRSLWALQALRAADEPRIGGMPVDAPKMARNNNMYDIHASSA